MAVEYMSASRSDYAHAGLGKHCNGCQKQLSVPKSLSGQFDMPKTVKTKNTNCRACVGEKAFLKMFLL